MTEKKVDFDRMEQAVALFGSFDENVKVAKRGGNVANVARQQLEAETGLPVITSENAVQLNAAVTEMIEAAAQGLSRHNAYVRRNRAANALPNGQIYAAFVEEYPDVRPEDIPQQVWEWAQQEGSLVSAYRKWEIAELRDELAALEMNRRNRRAAVGTAQTDGEPAGIDPVTLALLGR